jgi:uncharacterized SAM-binding protein YcdF (DUF218 family)
MDTAFFITAKLVGGLLRAETWLLIVLSVSLVSLLAQKRVIALWGISCALVLVFTLSVFPIGNSVLAHIEATYPAEPDVENVDGIIVLGGGGDVDVWRRWNLPELGEGGDRFTAALKLYRKNPKSIIVFTGGSGHLRDAFSSKKSESGLAQEFFIEQGIQPDRLILEVNSRNTAENAKFTINLVQPKEDKKWVLVTSAFHMPRAMLSFQTAGWRNLTAYPVDFRTASFISHTGWNFERNLRNLNIVVREVVGQLVYRLTIR